MVITMNRSVSHGPPPELIPLMTRYDPDYHHSNIRQGERFTLIKDRLVLDEVIDILVNAILNKLPAHFNYLNEDVTGICTEIVEYDNLPAMISKPVGMWGWNGCYIVLDTTNNKHYLMATHNSWKIEMVGECYKCKHGCKMPKKCPLYEE